jgi:hypothetical protein
MKAVKKNSNNKKKKQAKLGEQGGFNGPTATKSD